MPGDLDVSPPHRNRGWGWRLITALAAAALATGLLVVLTHANQPGGTNVQLTPVQPTSVHGVSRASHRLKELTSPQSSRGRLRTPAGATGRGAHQVPVLRARSSISEIEMSGSLLIIPSLHVRAPLVPTGAVGAPETASLMIPPDIHEVGWWDGEVRDGRRTIHEDAPAPGQPGVALIAGHVDSAANGPGALFDLRYLRAGDFIEISDSASHLSTWVVDGRPQMTPKAQLPPQLWVTKGPAQLALVTCGGPFDAATGHYVDNVIVWASELSWPQGR